MADGKDSGDFYSFETVLKELQIEEEDLKRLVSEGEIRAFRDEEKMKFKKTDIEGLKKGRMTEPTIILPSKDPDESSVDSDVLLVETSETMLDIDNMENFDAIDSASTSVPSVDFSSSEFEVSSEASGSITEELTFEEDSGSYVLESSNEVSIDSSELSAVEEDVTSSAGADKGSFYDSDTGLQTEPLSGLDVDTDSSDIQSYPSLDAIDDSGETKDLTGYGSSDTYLEDDVAAQPQSSPAKSPRKTVEADAEGMRTAALVERTVPISVVQEMHVSTGMTCMLVLSALLLLYAGIFVVHSIKDLDTGATGWLTDLTYKVTPAKHLADDRGQVSPQKVQTQLKWRESKRKKPGA